MDFKAITIMGKSYGEIDEKLMKVSAIENNKPKINNVDFNDHNFFKQFEDEQSPEHEFIKEALFFLAICHTIIVENKKDEPIFNASSPDELALVSFARFSGVEFIGFDENNSMMVKYKEKIFNFKLLYVFEFDSIRKRQSVIIQKENGEICLYCKGADSVIENLLDKEKSSKNQ